MLHQRILLFIFCTSWVCSAKAAEQTIRLDLDGPLKNVPVMDQDGKQFCYAYATAQLIDAARFKNGDSRTNHITSPVMLAIEASQIDRSSPGGSRRTDPNYMFPWNAIEAAKENGSCNHLKVRDNFPSKNLEGYIDGLKDYHRQIEELARMDWGLERIKRTYATVKNCQNFVHSTTGATASALSIYSALTANNPIDSLAKFYKAQCAGNNIPVNLPEYTAHFKKGFSEKGTPLDSFTESINQALSKKNPVGLVYCQNVLKEKNYRGIQGPGSLAGDCIYHVSAIVGSRTVGGSKEFLVRDSYGISCLPYAAHDCERGQVWISEKELEENATHIYSFN